ncbi:HPF/RaiA family ribosome-associated protein [Ectothiorhodospiraceae bacterium 2226]|nr:HPF/RaiA family ribosome-associated protein [Ectothiorhodospiraceae bacterium 2226]
MQVPLEISFHGVDRSEWAEAFIRRQVERMERYAGGGVIGCRVAVELPHRHQHSGKPYHVRVEITLPSRKDLVAVAEPVRVDQEIELRTVIRDAFEAMERQIKRAVATRRHEVKVHDEPVALVARLFPDQDYGFLKTPDGRDIYFHRNAVLHDDYTRLAVGTQVRFVEFMGEDGPQASTVQIIDKPGVRAGTAEQAARP